MYKCSFYKSMCCSFVSNVSRRHLNNIQINIPVFFSNSALSIYAWFPFEENIKGQEKNNCLLSLVGKFPKDIKS